MSVTRYSRDVDLADLNNAHTFAVLAVPPGSRVLDLGASDGSVARVLQARGCAVTAVERDPSGLQALAAHGIPFVNADLDALDGVDLPRRGFDVILLLDVLEHLVDPAALLARVRSWLAPGGRLLISVPNVAHAAVRLSLLQGRFPRTDTGLLDRTHLHFFDRPQLDLLLTGAGLHALDVVNIERSVSETELPVPEDLPAGVMEVVAADPLSRVYQFFVVAVPGTGSSPGGGLLQAVASRLRNVEHAYRALEDHAIRTEMDGAARLDGATGELRRVGEYVAHLEAQVRDLSARVEAQARDLGGQLQALARERDERLGEQARVAGEQLEAQRLEAGARLESHALELTARFDARERELRAQLEAQERDLRAQVEATRLEADARLELQAREHRAQLEASRLEASARLELQANELGARFDERERDLHAQRERLESEVAAVRDALHALERTREEGREQMAARLIDLTADRDMLCRQLADRMGELRQATETVAVLLRDVAVQREFAAALAAQVPELAARGGEARVLAELDEYRTVAPTPASAAALASEAAELRRLQEALAIKALARLDAVARRTPKLRSALRSMARRLAGSRR